MRHCIPNFRPIGAVGASLWASQNAIFGKKLKKVITAFWPARLRGMVTFALASAVIPPAYAMIFLFSLVPESGVQKVHDDLKGCPRVTGCVLLERHQ